MWAEVQLHSIATVGEGLALRFYKVKFTERKCFGWFIQKNLLVVGSTKGTSYYPPQGTCTPELLFSALLLILSARSPLDCIALKFSPALFFYFTLLPMCLSLNLTHHITPCCLSFSVSAAPSSANSHFQFYRCLSYSFFSTYFFCLWHLTT